MTGTKSIEELYSTAPDTADQQTAVEQVQPTEQTGAAEAAPAAQQGSGEAGEGAPPASTPRMTDKTVPLSALEDERRKRQSLESRLAEMERKLNPRQDEAVDPVVDPDAFRTRIMVDRFEDRLSLAEDVLIDKVGEQPYRAAEQAVLQAAAADQSFARSFGQEVARAKNPAKYTYEMGQRIIQAAESRDPDKMRERLKAEIMAELGIKTAQGQQTAPKAAPRVPPSLAGVQSQVSRNEGSRAVKRRSIEELYE